MKMEIKQSKIQNCGKSSFKREVKSDDTGLLQEARKISHNLTTSKGIRKRRKKSKDGGGKKE